MYFVENKVFENFMWRFSAVLAGLVYPLVHFILYGENENCNNKMKIEGKLKLHVSGQLDEYKTHILNSTQESG